MDGGPALLRVEDRFNFRQPDYDAVWAARSKRIKSLRSQPGAFAALREYYKDKPAAFITDWGTTFDPRNPEAGLPAIMPFILFQRQVEVVDWLHERWLCREDGLVEKSRDMGLSWVSVGFAIWMWLHHPGTVVGFGSRKEEYVDKLGDPKSLFWKAREFIRLLPIEMRPVGWNPTKHAPHMRIINPENGCAIVGESGDNIGRGNRTAIYFKDESAHYERADSIEAALSQTSNCKIDISSVAGSGNTFALKRFSGKVKVFTFNWRDDPRKDEAWYAKQCEKYDAVIVAQEIDIDYNASKEDSWIDGQLVAKAINNGPAQVQAIGPWVVGVDAAHMGGDKSVISLRKGRLTLPQIKRTRIDGIQLAALVEEECRKLELSGKDRVGTITIELDGPGVSCYDQLKQGKFAQCVNGIHTGAKLADGRNYNVKALMWRNGLEYLKDEPCSLPNSQELKAQLSAMGHEYRGGLLLMQNKGEYKSENGHSPDEADSWMLTHAPWTDKRAQKHAMRVVSHVVADSATGY